MRTIDEILDAEFETVTPEEWELLRSQSTDEADEPSDLEQRLAASVSDWDKFAKAISDILNN
ncbi:hypothetical protein [Leptolyngbya sp. FACHB-16]|uniref:hypothetical protein n=1 Tax=unclassified Leptolyngbya TaxID=2650499 RepID=UPI00168704A2|nr:hypothetical protein [Leptolyngbya sp. FACHB-16]MBD2156273.1 hypothetical protein [Leptolyngbya sp. FACHB-16]